VWHDGGRYEDSYLRKVVERELYELQSRILVVSE